MSRRRRVSPGSRTVDAVTSTWIPLISCWGAARVKRGRSGTVLFNPHLPLVSYVQL